MTKRLIALLPLMMLAFVACSEGGAESGGGDPNTENPGGTTPTPNPTPDLPDDEYVESADLTFYNVKSVAELNTLQSSGKLKATDVIIWKDGTYSNQQITFSAANVVLRAETLGGVKFTGSSKITIKGKGSRVRGFQWINPSTVTSSIITLDKTTSGSIVEECVIDGKDLKADPSHDSKWVSVYGTKNIIRHCTFNNKMNMGTTFVVWFEDNKTPGHYILDNYFTRPQIHLEEDGGAKNGQETIRIGTSGVSMSAGKCIVMGNHFYHCHGERAEIISNKSCFNHYENNLFDASMGTITLRHGNDCVITRNFTVNDEKVSGVGGIRVIGERHKVLDNYIEHTTGGGFTSGLCTVRGLKDSPLSGYYQVQHALIDGNVLVDCLNAITSNYNSANTMPVITTTVSNNKVISTSPRYCTVTHFDDYSPDITYKDNEIYGGYQKGFDDGKELAEAETMPEYTRPTEAIEKLRAEAGASYYEKVYKK